MAKKPEILCRIYLVAHGFEVVKVEQLPDGKRVEHITYTSDMYAYELRSGRFRAGAVQALLESGTVAVGVGQKPSLPPLAMAFAEAKDAILSAKS